MTGGRLPLTVVGGYLGAGKTTLINALLADPAGERIAVLVNDFGDIDIDARLMDSDDADVMSLTNGCICCSLADGFAEALDRIRDLAGRIDRVVIEVSGVGDPRKVAQWGHVPGFTLDGVVVLVDAKTVRERSRDRYVGETVLAQLAGADLVVVTRADLLDDTVTSEVERWLADMVAAPVLRAPVPTAVLFGSDPIGDVIPEQFADQIVLTLEAGRQDDKIRRQRVPIPHLGAIGDEAVDFGKLYNSNLAVRDQIRATDIEIISTAALEIFELPTRIVGVIDLEPYARQPIKEILVECHGVLGHQLVRFLHQLKRHGRDNEVAVL
ncbi:MAG: hypothetical protein DSY73_02100 [Actinobacteria bacterium]|nr:MAG: hypothetical protein DSY73_02100 [Actinomycetota bacterium]